MGGRGEHICEYLCLYRRVKALGDIATTGMYTLMVRNIPAEINKEGLRKMFSQFGVVSNCYIGNY